MTNSSEILEHVGEVRLRVRGPSIGALAVEAGRALASLELGRPAPPGRGDPRAVEVRSTDREALLVDWLNELIFLAETQCWVATEFEIESESDSHVRARARGVDVEEAPARVKAATFHGLRVTPVPEGLEAEVVFDV